MPILYNSRDKACKTPFGAVYAGVDVTFTVRVPRAEGASHVFFCAAFEFDRVNTEQKMDWLGLDETDCDKYRYTLSTTDRLGPVWYHFKVERYDKFPLYAGVDPGRLDGNAVTAEYILPPFQLTVYDKRFSVPAWYGKGITYHIFPDRFHRLSTPDPAGLVGNRTVHEDWADVPDYLPNENGEILNRDFFGGSAEGVMAKLPYLAELGVRTIYFSPIFEAASNHRYDTADYLRVDPMFGDEASFSLLCKEAEKLHIRVMLDGVFNHTGYDSRYFNARGAYPDLGAHQSKDSPYYDWYDFQEWPYRYSSWWGVYTLPQVNESAPSYMRFIAQGQGSVIRHWLRLGASAWRLDVADELPDDFIVALRKAVREEKRDAVLIGEVWEDATNKISYDVRRRYLLGHELDGVMNYPFRNALLGYLLGGDAARFKNEMETIRENYPMPAYYSLMNIIGTHDTPRALTILGVQGHEYGESRAMRAAHRLPPDRRALALRRMKLASVIQFTFPGSPCVYYGDEAGMEGFEDPFNRRAFPWGQEEEELVLWYQKLGKIRNTYSALHVGDISYLTAEGPLLAFVRSTGSERCLTAVNRSFEAAALTLPWGEPDAADLLSGERFSAKDGALALPMPPLTGRILK